MIINHNMNAMNAHRNMSTNNVNAGKAMEKLSSGLRINKAGDDAAGLAISEKMRGQIRGLDQAGRNSQDGISMVQTAEGALNETHSILQRMRELAVQGANDANDSESRDAIQTEMNQLTSEINRIGNTTEFNTQKLLNGGATGATASASATNAKMTGSTLSLAGLGTGDTFTIVGTTSATVTLATADFANTTALLTKINNVATAADVSASLVSGKLVLTSTATAGSTDSFTVSGTNVALFGLTSGAKATGNDAVAVGDEIAGTGYKADLQIGANQGQAFHIELNDMRAGALGISGDASASATHGATFTASSATEGVTNGTTEDITEYALDITSHDNATNAIKVLDDAITEVSTERSKLGAYQNRLEHTIANLGTASENLTSAESRVRDVDMAKEMMTFSKNNILSQAAQAMLAQANQQPQGVLQLLR